MNERRVNNQSNNNQCNQCNPCCGDGFKEAVCIHTEKVYDSCRDKDCLENVRVYLTGPAQDIVNNSINVKCTKAEIIWVFSEENRCMYKISNRGNALQGFGGDICVSL